MFKIILNNNKSLEINNVLLKEDYGGYETWEAIVADICEVFNMSEEIEFIVMGFGQDKWPVDCMYDLLCVAENLPKIIMGFSENIFNFELDFYEQGLERKLTFKDKGTFIEIFCKSRTKWKPEPLFECTSKKELVEMILKLYRKFIFYSQYLCKNLLENPLMDKFILEDTITKKVKTSFGVSLNPLE